MRKRKRLIIGLSIALLGVSGALYGFTQPASPASFLHAIRDRVTLIDERGSYDKTTDEVEGSLIFAVQMKAEDLLPEIQKLGKLSATQYAHEATKPVWVSARNGLALSLGSSKVSMVRLAAARPVEHREGAGVNLPSDGWSTVIIAYRRPLSGTERLLQRMGAPWTQWRFGKAKELRYPADQSSKLADVYNRIYPDQPVYIFVGPICAGA